MHGAQKTDFIEVKMIYLILAVLASSAVSIIMRHGEGRVKDSFAMFMANYFVCSAIALGFVLAGDKPTSGEGFPFALLLGAFAGILYLTCFVFLKYNITRNGVMLASVFMKLGVIIPLLIAIIFFKESPSALQLIGFIIAAAAIIIIYFEKDPEKKKRKGLSSAALLILLFIIGGLTNSLANIYEKLGYAQYKNHYMLFTFLSAFLLSTAVTVYKKHRVSKYDVIYGAAIGVPNYFATRLLILSLSSVPAVIVYPVYNVGAIVLIGLAGMFIFRESVKGRRLIGYIMIIASLILLNI